MTNTATSIRTYIRKAIPQLSGLLAASFAVAASEVMLALSMKRALEMLISGERSGALSFALLFLGVILFAGIGYYFVGVAGAKFKKKILYTIKQDYAGAILNMSTRDFSSHSIGAISSSATDDVNKLETQYFDTAIKIVQQCMRFVLASVTLFYFSPLLALCVYIFAVAIVFLPRKSYQKMTVLGKLYSDSMAEYNTKIQEVLGGFSVIKASNMRTMFYDEIDRLNEKNERARYTIGVKEARITSLLAILSLMTFYIPFLIGAIFVLIGNVEIGVLIAVVNLSGSVITPIQQVGSNIARLRAGQGIFSKILDIINQSSNASSTRLLESTVQIDNFESTLNMRNVSFKYEDREVVTDFSIEIKKGAKVLILGPSGVGKSTILKLIAGLYDDYSGSIAIDGQEVKDISRESFAKIISFIPQETFLFNRTIKENIILSEQENEDRLETACRDAALSDCIMQLENGINTRLGDGAQSLSGGEKQRVGVARALYQDTPIILADEPTASLDESNSGMIFDILLNSNKTVICVSHKIQEQQRQQFDSVIYLEKNKGQ